MVGSEPIVSEDAAIGDGSVIGYFAALGVHGPPEHLRVGANSVIRSHSVIYRGVSIGDSFQTGHGVLVREYTQIGNNVSIGTHSVVEHHVTIKDDVRIHSNCFIPEFTVLESGAWLGPAVVVTNAKYPNRPETKQNLSGVTVGVGAVVGAGAVLLPGVVIGDGAIVGAGAVVTKSIDAGATFVGNPARRTE